MSGPSYATTFSVDQTPEEAFAAITNVRGWWSENIDGATDTVDGEFTYSREDTHACTIKVVELVPGKSVRWRVLDNRFDFTEDQTEWIGTEMAFDVAGRGDQTDVHFSHVGLYPDHECFDVCSSAWHFYIDDSLRNLIATGEGKPNPREDARGDAAITPKPGSLLLGTTRPEELRAWYRTALAPDHEGDGPIDLGGFLLVIDGRDDVGDTSPEPGRMILNFHVDDIDAVGVQLRSAGVEWLAPVADRPSGRFGTFVDPDGNYLQVIQFTKDGEPGTAAG